jgi:hypothetical protein
MLFKDEAIKYLLEIKGIADKGEANEVSYRTPLENFLNELLVYYKLEKNLLIRHEDRAINTEYGNATPDFAIKTQQGSLSIGFIETKKPQEPYFSEIEKSAQIKKYLSISDNIIATNYLNFKFLTSKENSTNVVEISFGSAEYLSESYLRSPNADPIFQKLETYFRNFFCKEVIKIGNPKQLAVRLANISNLLREYLLDEINKQALEGRGELHQIYESFRDNLSEEMDREEFIDAFAQMVSYAVFLAKLNIKNDNEVELSNTQLTMNNIKQYININFSLIAEMVKYLDVLTNPKKDISGCAWLLEELLFVVNNIDMYAFGEHLTYNKSSTQKLADPYFDFYENFLQQYDKDLKVDRGVYYTPAEVVQYIVKSTSEILKQEFGIAEGFANSQVKVLDFATGTGTFMLDVYKEILDDLPSNSAKTTSIIKEIVLKNIYGFEYLMAPYVVAHLKLSEYLKSKGYVMNIHERIQVYLTNTLSALNPQYDSFLPELSHEGEKAHEIKSQENIMVVLGNPPYNSKSKNPIVDKLGKENFIGALLKTYKPSDEKKMSLDDDYIKFIRFAHNKLANQPKGVLAVVVNNSFINGLTHRKMRNELLKEFSSIYILNLQGSGGIRGEAITPDGDLDENVFKIQQGVAIAIFVKNDASKKIANVYYQDLWGKRVEKYNYLANNTYSTTTWQKLDIEGFNSEFAKSLWANQKEETSKQSKAKKKELASLFTEEDLRDNNQSNYITKKRFIDDLSFFVPMQKDGILEYSNSIGMNEIFVEYLSGIQTKRDDLTIQLSKNEINNVILDLKTLSNEKIREKYNLPKDNTWILQKAIEVISNNKGNIELIQRKPFDNRYTYYSAEQGFLARPRYKVLQHYLVDNNYGFVFVRNVEKNSYNNFSVTKKIVDMNFMTYQSYTAPIYITETAVKKIDRQVSNTKQIHSYKEERWINRDNFSTYFKNFIKEKYNLDISYSGGEQFNENNINKENIELVSGYIYAIMYSKPYKEKYIEYLKIDFPRIIFVDNREQFLELATLGKLLMKAHVNASLTKEMKAILSKEEAQSLEKNKSQFLYSSTESSNNNIVIKSNFDASNNKLHINKTAYFSNVTEDVYNYSIEGKILEKYINARKNRELSLEEIQHLENVIQVLGYTLLLEHKIVNLSYNI